MKKIISLILAFLLIAYISISMPTAKATDVTDFFGVTTDGYSCSGKITYKVYLRQGVSLSGASIRFKYNPGILEVVECGAYMTTDSYGDPVESVPGIYENGKIKGSNNIYGIIFANTGDEDYSVQSADKPFVQVTFKLKENILAPFPQTTVNITCFEFLSYKNPEANIFRGEEQIIKTAKDSPKEHSFNNNVCSACKCLCFEYVKNQSGITVTKYNGRQRSFSIPSTVDGFSVTRIGNGAEPLCSNVVDVTIPDSVKSIDAGVFNGTSFYINSNNWSNGALFVDNFLIDTNEKLPHKYYVDSSVKVIADKAFEGFSGYMLCEKDSNAHKYALANGVEFIIPTISPADSKTTVNFPNQLIFTSVLKCKNVKSLVNIPTAITVTTDSNNGYCGTGATITAFNGTDYMGDYTIIATGDLDGDGVCDVIDASLAAKYSAELATPSTEQIYAANGAIAEEIDVLDYQNVVNLALK